MITIDIEARALARETRPAVQFRRTATDRPGRPWRQPNDGPAPDRLARAEARREMLTRKTVQPVETNGIPRSETFERNMTRTMRAMSEGKAILPEIAPVLGVCTDRARDFCVELVARGLAWKRLENRQKGRSFCAYYLTDAGKAALDGGGDGQS